MSDDHKPAAAFQDLKRRMVDRANENDKQLTGDMAEIWAIVNGADVVFAVWQDRGEPDGVGMLIVKGAHLIQHTAEGAVMTAYKPDAIKCINAAQAHALKGLIREKDARH